MLLDRQGEEFSNIFILHQEKNNPREFEGTVISSETIRNKFTGPGSERKLDTAKNGDLGDMCFVNFSATGNMASC